MSAGLVKHTTKEMQSAKLLTQLCAMYLYLKKRLAFGGNGASTKNHAEKKEKE